MTTDAQRIAQIADEERRLGLNEALGEPVGELGVEIRERVLAQNVGGNFFALDRALQIVRPSPQRRIDAIFADPAAQAAAELLGAALPTTFVLPRCRYLGGFDDVPGPVDGVDLVGVAPLMIVAYRRGGEPLFLIPGDMIAGITVEGGDEVVQRVTVPRVLLLGPLAWALKRDVNRAFFVVEAQSGLEAFFETTAIGPRELRARFQPIIREFVAEPAPMAPPATAPAAAADPIQRLRDLAALRDEGILDDEEFEQEKRAILNAMHGARS